MVYKNKENIINNAWIIVWVLLFVSIFNLSILNMNTSFIFIRIIVLITLCITGFYFLKNKHIKLYNFFYLGVAFVIIQILSSLINANFSSLYTVAQTVLVFSFLIFTSIIDYKEINIIFYKYSYYVVFVIFALDTFFNRSRLHKYLNIGDNTLGGILLYISIFNLILLKIKPNLENNRIIATVDYICIFMLLPMFTLLRARTALFTLIVMMLIYFLITKFKDIFKWKYFFFLFISIIFGVLIFYIFFHKMPFYKFFNDISVRIFRKNINSSRPRLWIASINELQNMWIFGLSPGFIPKSFMKYESFHNQFIQILMQTGLSGITIFIMMLNSIWKEIIKHIDDKVSILCATTILGIIIYNNFETTLMQNKLLVGLVQWQIIGFSLWYTSRLGRNKL